jgi:hypothetical protein
LIQAKIGILKDLKLPAKTNRNSVPLKS